MADVLIFSNQHEVIFLSTVDVLNTFLTCYTSLESLQSPIALVGREMQAFYVLFWTGLVGASLKHDGANW